MFGQEFMRNALLCGTFVALACAVCGWFLVLRGQMFAGDALGHVAFPGALAAAAAGFDERIGLIVATVGAALAIGVLGRATAGSRGGAPFADDTTIGIVFTFILAVGLFFMTRFTTSTGATGGVVSARALFGSIFGLGAGEAALAAVVSLLVVVATLAIARPLLFSSVAPEAAGARGVRSRTLALGFLALVGVAVAAASQAVGALLALGLLAAPAGAAHRLTRGPAAGLAVAGAIGLIAMWGGLTLAYVIPSLPPSSAVIGVAAGVYYLSRIFT